MLVESVRLHAYETCIHLLPPTGTAPITPGDVGTTLSSGPLLPRVDINFGAITGAVQALRNQFLMRAQQRLFGAVDGLFAGGLHFGCATSPSLERGGGGGRQGGCRGGGPLHALRVLGLCLACKW